MEKKLYFKLINTGIDLDYEQMLNAYLVAVPTETTALVNGLRTEISLDPEVPRIFTLDITKRSTIRWWFESNEIESTLRICADPVCA